MGHDRELFPPLHQSAADGPLRMSTRFMRLLLDRTGGRADLALSAYYQGLKPTLEGKILDETKRYVAGVLSFRASF